jgi:uncharacterized membrane protein
MNEIKRVEIKEEAKKSIKGKVFSLFVANLIVLVLTAPINAWPFIGTVIAIAAMVLVIGLNRFYLNFIDYGKTDYADIFFPFIKDLNIFLKHLGTILLRALLVFLWTLLFIVPGIIKALAYSQVTYIRAEKPEQDIMDSLKESEALMDGHKGEYFVLQLSFIGWFLLAAITFGIALIYVLPYYSVTMTNYYRRLRPKEQEMNPNREPSIS